VDGRIVCENASGGFNAVADAQKSNFHSLRETHIGGNQTIEPENRRATLAN